MEEGVAGENHWNLDGHENSDFGSDDESSLASDDSGVTIDSVTVPTLLSPARVAPPASPLAMGQALMETPPDKLLTK